MWTKKKVDDDFVYRPQKPRVNLATVAADGTITRPGDRVEREEEEVEEPVAPTPEYKDLELADKIKVLWVDEDKPAVEVCTKLGISLGVFNRIIIRYSISKKRNAEDENFGA